ncbi:MAG: alpha/beta fold hydrolase [Candidatus Krumholzibacteria bacterium]|nr:alpha/beta fold hydrolase [Candidatus Krumholzibacteria bacterium]
MMTTFMEYARAKLWLFLLFVLCAVGCGDQKVQPVQTDRPYLETDVVVRNPIDGVTLAGTLTLPASTGSFPAVLLIAGSGPHDRDEEFLGHRPFFILADYLARLGMTVLRMDKRGCGESEGVYIPYDIERFVQDAQSAVTFLRQHKQVDPHRIGVIGHSQGGLIAPMLASQSTDISFVVLMAAPGEWGPGFFRSQAIAMARAAGFGERDFERIRQLYDRLTPIWTKDTIAASDEREGTRIIEELRLYVDAGSRKILGNENAASFLAFMRSNEIRSFLDYDPATTLRRLSCPVLAIIGDKDVQVPSSQNLAAIENALREGGNERYRIVEAQGLNHLFQTCTTGLVSEYATMGRSMSTAALDVIGEWLGEVVGLGQR